MNLPAVDGSHHHSSRRVGLPDRPGDLRIPSRQAERRSIMDEGRIRDLDHPCFWDERLVSVFVFS
jgi:hypothetical protein